MTVQVEWNVVSYKPFIHRVVVAETANKAIEKVFEGLEKNELIDLERFNRHIVSGEDESYVVQLCLPKTVHQLFAANLLQLLVEVDCIVAIKKPKLTPQYMDKVWTLSRLLFTLEKHYQDRKAIGQIRETAELLYSHVPNTMVGKAREYDYLEFSPTGDETIKEMLIKAILTEPIDCEVSK